MKPIEHNSAVWEVRTNRHPNTDGSSWGWIDGAPGNVCWSNNEPFNRSRAGEVVAEHNAWLERQRPVDLRIVDARKRMENLSAELARLSDMTTAAMTKYRAAESYIALLESEKRRPQDDEAFDCEDQG